jgi:hypothetical protein
MQLSVVGDAFSHDDWKLAQSNLHGNHFSVFFSIPVQVLAISAKG